MHANPLLAPMRNADSHRVFVGIERPKPNSLSKTHIKNKTRSEHRPETKLLGLVTDKMELVHCNRTTFVKLTYTIQIKSRNLSPI